jgi:hypothetical protein
MCLHSTLCVLGCSFAEDPEYGIRQNLKQLVGPPRETNLSTTIHNLQLQVQVTAHLQSCPTRGSVMVETGHLRFFCLAAPLARRIPSPQQAYTTQTSSDRDVHPADRGASLLYSASMAGGECHLSAALQRSERLYDQRPRQAHAERITRFCPRE